jgi:cytochrome c
MHALPTGLSLSRFCFLGLALAPLLAGCGGGATLDKNDPKVKALLAELPPAYAAADLSNGRNKFGLCRQCHTIVKDGPNMTGPNLYGVFGKRTGTNQPGFAYSNALKASGMTWDAAALDRWIADPRAVLPKTKMAFPGLADPNDRRDVIAYLKVASSGGPN